MNCELGECAATAIGRVDKYHNVPELANLKGKSVCGYHNGVVRQAGLKVFTFEYLERKRLERQVSARATLAELVGSKAESQLGDLLEALLSADEESPPEGSPQVGVPV